MCRWSRAALPSASDMDDAVANIELEQAEYRVVMTHGRAAAWASAMLDSFACGESNICH